MVLGVPCTPMGKETSIEPVMFWGVLVVLSDVFQS